MIIIIIAIIVIGALGAGFEEQKSYQNINKLTKELEKEKKKNKSKK